MKYSKQILAFLALTSSGVQPFTLNKKLINNNGSRLQASTIETEATKERNGRTAPKSTTTKKENNVFQQVQNSSIASAAAVATAAVNAAVAMKTLDAPDVSKSYISLNSEQSSELDEEGLPLQYDKDAIQKYWSQQRGALNQRWSYFVGKAVPFLTQLVTLFITEGKIDEKHIPRLTRQAREDIQDLGPTFIKLGQMMSVRPDVLPQSALEELAVLQDSVVPFETETAVKVIERELGGPLGQFFTSISEEPVAAASLAQVYLATLNDGNDTKVAIKVQRPEVLGTISKDLYVLRRAAEVFQGLFDRFAPQQRTDYVALLNEWAIGFYTELDFANEAKNQIRLRNLLIKNDVTKVTVPKVFEELTTRRILVSEWMDGKKLSDCDKEKVKEVTAVAQEAFLVQLFEEGFFHADPHPGNIMLLNEETEDGASLALIDCGLMASIQQEDRDNMISAVIHLANKDYASLVDDFMKLKILPEDSDRAAIIPLMDKALSPYVKGGGAKKYEEELKKMYGMEDGSMQSQVGGFQAMTSDALTVMNDIPFSIPPYFAILGRAIVTLEGIALTGDPDYGIIMESYPYIARKLLREDRPEIQRALQEVLYSSNNGESGALKFTRLLALLNNAAGSVGKKEGGAFVDLDAVPEDGLAFADGLRYLLSDNAESLRNLLEPEIDNLVDIISRQIIRKGLSQAIVALAPPRPPTLPFLGDVLPQPPKFDEIPLPILLPGKNGTGSTPSVGVLSLQEFTDKLAPKLDRDDEIYAISVAEVVDDILGPQVGKLIRGDNLFSVNNAQTLLKTVQSGMFGKSIVSSEAVTTVTTSLGNALTRLQNNSSDGQFDEVFTVVDDLNTEERDRFDDVVQNIVSRTLERATDRLADIPRVL